MRLQTEQQRDNKQKNQLKPVRERYRSRKARFSATKYFQLSLPPTPIIWYATSH